MEEKYGIFQPRDNTPYFQVLFKKKKEVLLETSEAWVEIEIKADPLRKKWDMDYCWGKNYYNDVCCLVIMFRL